jgi:hypothetical protein
MWHSFISFSNACPTGQVKESPHLSVQITQRSGHRPRFADLTLDKNILQEVIRKEL